MVYPRSILTARAMVGKAAFTSAVRAAKEELALPVKGKNSKLTRNDLLTYFARERLRINERVLNDVLSRFARAIPAWRELLNHSFLSADAKEQYAAVLTERAQRMQF
jgi:serine/threonine-protein kinase HipA